MALERRMRRMLPTWGCWPSAQTAGGQIPISPAEPSSFLAPVEPVFSSPGNSTALRHIVRRGCMDQHQFGSIDPPYPAEPIGDRNRQSELRHGELSDLDFALPSLDCGAGLGLSCLDRGEGSLCFIFFHNFPRYNIGLEYFAKFMAYRSAISTARSSLHHAITPLTWRDSRFWFRFLALAVGEL